MASPEILHGVFKSSLVSSEHADLEQYLAIVLTKYAGSIPPGFSRFWREETDEDGNILPVLDVVLASDKCKPAVLVSLVGLYNPFPDEYAGIVTSRSYVSPDYRHRRMWEPVFRQAISAATEFRNKFRKPGQPLLPVILVENIVIPDEPDFAGVKAGVRRTVVRNGYRQAAENDPDFYFCLV